MWSGEASRMAWPSAGHALRTALLIHGILDSIAACAPSSFFRTVAMIIFCESVSTMCLLSNPWSISNFFMKLKILSLMSNPLIDSYFLWWLICCFHRANFHGRFLTKFSNSHPAFFDYSPYLGFLISFLKCDHLKANLTLVPRHEEFKLILTGEFPPWHLVFIVIENAVKDTERKKSSAVLTSCDPYEVQYEWQGMVRCDKAKPWLL